MVKKTLKKKLIRTAFACAFLCMGVFGCASEARQAAETTATEVQTDSTEETAEDVTEETTPAERTEESPEESTGEMSTEFSTEAPTDTEPRTIEPVDLTEEVSSQVTTDSVETLPEVPTDPVIPPTEAPTEAITEPVVPPTEAPTQPVVPPTEAPTEPSTEPVVPPTEPSTEPVVPPTEAPTEPPLVVVSVWYTTSALNLREGPSLNHKILLTIPENTAVDCLEEGAVWSRVIYQGVIGYVATGYLADEPLISFPGYGEIAYSHVRYINDHFAFRLNGNNYGPEKKDACGNWIEKKMKSFGYEPTYYEGIAPVSGMPVKSYAFRKSCGVENVWS